MPFPDMDYISKNHGIGLWIDLRFSRNRLRDEFRNIINYMTELHKMACEKRGIRYERPEMRRYHYENFDMYLKVYDLKKAGKSWNKIKAMLNFSDIQTARNHYEAAKNLIRRGID